MRTIGSYINKEIADRSIRYKLSKILINQLACTDPYVSIEFHVLIANAYLVVTNGQ